MTMLVAALGGDFLQRGRLAASLFHRRRPDGFQKFANGAGVPAMVSSSLKLAKSLKPSSSARSCRNSRMREITSRLSVSPGFSPRDVQALKAASRRSRRVEN